MDYRVVFDVARTWPDLTATGSGVFFMLVCAAMVYSVRRDTTSKTRTRGPVWSPYVFFGFSIIWTVVATFVPLREWQERKRAMRDGDVEIVEGTVHDFSPMPARGRRPESFTVSGRTYEIYRAQSANGAFALPSAEGGPVREGQHVRIHDDNGAIVKLEIEASQLPMIEIDPSVGARIPKAFYFIPLLLLAGVPLIAFVISWTGGWRGLALRFAGEPLEGAERYVMQSGAISLLGAYNNVLNVSVADEAFSMVPMLPGGFFHALLVIPWAKVSRVERRREFFSKLVVVTLDSGNQIKLRGEVGEAVLEAFDRSRAGKRDIRL